MRSSTLVVSVAMALSLAEVGQTQGVLRPASASGALSKAAGVLSNPAGVDWAVLKQLPRPVAMPSIQGRIPLYRRGVGGSFILSANVVMAAATPVRNTAGAQPSVKGSSLRAVMVDQGRRSALMTGSFPPIVKRSAATLWGVSPPILVRPDSRVEICGWGFDDSVTVRITRDDDDLPEYTASWRRATIRSGDDVGCTDATAVGVAGAAPPGHYLLTVLNKGAYWSNPAPLTIRSAYPSTEYLVSHMQHLDIPFDLDHISILESGTEEGEFRFDFATGTGTPSSIPALQQISLGAHPSKGFEVLDHLRLDRGELQLPLFVQRRDRMGDALLFTFFGREFDGSSGSWAGWPILGGLAGAAAGGYFAGADTVAAGYHLGAEVGKLIGDALAGGGETSLGSHTNVFTKDNDYGLNEISYPSVLAFDNNLGTAGRSIHLMYKVRSIDAPAVHRVRVIVDSVDTRKIPLDKSPVAGVSLPPKQIYVYVRAFDGLVGTEFPENRRLPLFPEDSPNRASVLAAADRVIFDRNVAHDLPFLYFELTLWSNGYDRDRMVAKPLSRLRWPSSLITASEQSVVLHRSDIVAPAPGHGSKGQFTVYYTILIDR